MTDAPGAEDPLATLRTHVRNAQLAAERLAREAGRTPGREDGRPAAEAPDGPGTARPSAMPGAHEGTPFQAPGHGDERTPPSGWDPPAPEREATGELQALAELVESLRALLPEELRDQLNELVRQILLLLRAIIDWLVARIEREGPGREIELEDIPIS